MAADRRPPSTPRSARRAPRRSRASAVKRPRQWRQRAVTWPALLIGAPLLVLLSPVMFLATAFADLVTSPRRMRWSRLLAMALHYVVLGWLGLIAGGVLWLLTGFGLFMGQPLARRAHYRFQQWWTMAVLGGVERWLGARLSIEDGHLASDGPMIVAARHASFFDAVLPTVVLARHSDELSRHVLKVELTWEPLLDLFGHRHPNHFVRRGGHDRASELDAIAALAHDAGTEALVIFPEGTFRTAARAARLMERFTEHEPERAQRLRLAHLLPARPGGIGTLLDTRPDADLVLIAHTGFEPFGSFRSIIANVPFERPVEIKVWRVSASDLAGTPGERLAAIDHWWQKMDDWIGERQAAHAKDRHGHH